MPRRSFEEYSVFICGRNLCTEEESTPTRLAQAESVILTELSSLSLCDEFLQLICLARMRKRFVLDLQFEFLRSKDREAEDILPVLRI